MAAFLSKRRWVCTVLAALASGQALAQTSAGDAGAERWAIVSLIGDSLEMVVASPPNASRIDRGGTQTQNIPGSGFDRAVLLGARDALLQVKPAGAIAGFRPNLAFTADEQRELVSYLAQGTRVPWLMELLQKERIARAFVVTRDKGDAMLQTERGDPLGNRPVDGVGYYVDWHTEIRSDNLLQQGFLAPFVYLRVTQFDVSRAAVVRSHTIREGVAYGRNETAPDRDPWNMMTNVQKVEKLREMIQGAVRAATSKLVSAP